MSFVDPLRDNSLGFDKANSILHDDFALQTDASGVCRRFLRTHRFAQTVTPMSRFDALRKVVEKRMDGDLTDVCSLISNETVESRKKSKQTANKTTETTNASQLVFCRQRCLLVCYFYRGMLADAFSAAEARMEAVKRQFGPTSLATGFCLLDLAHLARHMPTNLTKAIPFCKLALQLFESLMCADNNMKGIDAGTKMGQMQFKEQAGIDAFILKLVALALLEESLKNSGQPSAAELVETKFYAAMKNFCRKATDVNDQYSKGLLAVADVLLAFRVYPAALQVYVEFIDRWGGGLNRTVLATIFDSQYNKLRRYGLHNVKGLSSTATKVEQIQQNALKSSSNPNAPQSVLRKFQLSTGLVEGYCCLAALLVKSNKIKTANDLLQDICIKFDKLPKEVVTAEQRLWMSRVLFQIAKLAAADGRYRKAVGLMLHVLRIRNNYDTLKKSNMHVTTKVQPTVSEKDLSSLMEEVKHSVSVLTSLQPALQRLVDEDMQV